MFDMTLGFLQKSSYVLIYCIYVWGKGEDYYLFSQILTVRKRSGKQFCDRRGDVEDEASSTLPQPW